jgi:hypothetical protein
VNLRLLPQTLDSARANRRSSSSTPKRSWRTTRAPRVIREDLRDAGAVLAMAAEVLDFSQPVGLLFVACLHNIPDTDDPAGIVGRYLAAVAPGSYLVISHVTGEFAPEKMQQVTEESAKRGSTFIGRSKEEITGLFNGKELVDPGVVLLSYWRPEGGKLEHNADRVWGYGGVART